MKFANLLRLISIDAMMGDIETVEAFFGRKNELSSKENPVCIKIQFRST